MHLYQLSAQRYGPTVLLGLVRRYITGRHQRGEISKSTRRSLWYGLSAFCAFMGDVPPSAITRKEMLRWQEQTTMSAATRRTRFSQLHMWFEWLIEEGVLDKDPTTGLKPPRIPRYVPRGMKVTDVRRVLMRCDSLRSRLIVLLMVQEGLRCCEVTSLQVGDVDFVGQLMVICGKGGHQRVLPISDETCQAMDLYLRESPAGSGPLVRSKMKPGVGISAAYVSNFMSRLMAEAGVKTRRLDGVSAHALRHTAATDMVRAGAHLRDVQAALGHASLQTTQRYLPWQVDDLRMAMGGRNYAPVSA